MDLCTLGVFVGAILSTVRRAFFVWRRSASGTSQRGYDFKPPGFSHSSSYPENKLFRCSIQICLTSFACLCFPFLDGSAANSPAHYLSSFIFLSFATPGSPDPRCFGPPPCLGHPVWPSHVCHPVNERIAGTSEGQCLACLRLPKPQNVRASRNEQGRAGSRGGCKGG
jgi:hypothetical protein